MAAVTFAGATRRYEDAPRDAVHGLDLQVADGELLVLVGPTGSGKSTVLRMLAGFEPVDGGAVLLGDRDLAGVDPVDRDVAMVFQTYALYPHMTVAANMGFALKIAGRPKDEVDRRVAEAAAVLDLTEHLHDRPEALTGEQRQRVALGRAIVPNPQVFCMDEPLANLDVALRAATRDQFADLQRRLGVTTLYVTHDQAEARAIGDRVAVLSQGVLHQVGDARTLEERPATMFVASYVGARPMNLLTVPLVGDGAARVGSYDVPLPRDAAAALRGDEVALGLRPDDLAVLADDGGDGIRVAVERVEQEGPDAFLHGRVVGAEDLVLVARVDAARPPAPGERVLLAPAPPHVFEPLTGARVCP